MNPWIMLEIIEHLKIIILFRLRSKVMLPERLQVLGGWQAVH